MIFDTHAHYDDERFDEDREQLLEKLPQLGVDYVVNVGADMKGSKDSIELAKSYPYIYASVGVHPSECAKMTDEDIDTLREYAGNDKVVAIGEIGLDYYWDEPDRQIQKKWFIKQLELACQLKMPVIIHSRDAANDTMEILREYHKSLESCVVHCFSYEKEIAKKCVDMGFYIGIGGVITFKNARKVRECVELIPIENILIETDCPYLAPEPNRGTRNDSSNLQYVVQVIADIKGISVEEVMRITQNNAKQFYKIG